MFDGFPAIFGIIPDFEARQFRASLAETSKRMDEKTFTLYRNAYGASRADIQRVGGTGDGGIDGVISLDKLGLEKVYVQAKRWQGTVDRIPSSALSVLLLNMLIFPDTFIGHCFRRMG